MNKSTSIALVTGGSGFIGSHLVDSLVNEYDHVIVVDKVRPPKERKNRKAKYVKIDVRDDDMQMVIKKYQPSVIFHLAAHLHDRESLVKPVENAMDNIVGLLQICEAVRKYAKAKMIFTSSGIVYGEQEQLPISETAIARPLSPYGVSKLTGERYLHYYNEVHGIPFVAVRPGNVYGPRQDASAESGVIGIFASSLLKGRTAVIHNDGDTTRDYVYVADLVEGLIKSARSHTVGVLNIGTGIQTSTRDIFDLVCEDVGVKTAPDWNETQEDLVKHIALDGTKIKTEMGWEPKTILAQGIERTVQWYRENS